MTNRSTNWQVNTHLVSYTIHLKRSLYFSNMQCLLTKFEFLSSLRVGSHQTCTGTFVLFASRAAFRRVTCIFMQMVHNFDHRGEPFQNQMLVSEYCLFFRFDLCTYLNSETLKMHIVLVFTPFLNS